MNLMVVRYDGEPLVITAGLDSELRSWRLNGARGPLSIDDMHMSAIFALAVANRDEAVPLIIAGGADGMIATCPVRLDAPYDAAAPPALASAQARMIWKQRGTTSPG